MKKNQYYEEIFSILNKEIKDYNPPVISNQDFKNIKKTPFTTLISCILSLRTKDEVTDIASKKLFEKYNTAEKLSRAPINDIEKLIFPVGFYHVKAKRIKDISKKLLDDYNGKVPNDFNELLKFKGVGRKTAAIVMVYGHNNENFIPVDVHVHVISNRLGWVKTKNPDDTMKELMDIVPKKYWYDLNEIFVKFGKKICVTISPFCSKCPIEKYCKKIGVKKSR